MSDTVTVTANGERETVTIEGGIVTVEEHNVSVVSVGTQGPAGPPGANGTGGDKYYEQTFTNASEITVTHNLGKYPSVTITDSSQDEVIGAIRHTSSNQLIVSFSASFSGKVICN